MRGRGDEKIRENEAQVLRGLFSRPTLARFFFEGWGRNFSTPTRHSGGGPTDQRANIVDGISSTSCRHGVSRPPWSRVNTSLDCMLDPLVSLTAPTSRGILYWHCAEHRRRGVLSKAHGLSSVCHLAMLVREPPDEPHARALRTCQCRAEVALRAIVLGADAMFRDRSPSPSLWMLASRDGMTRDEVTCRDTCSRISPRTSSMNEGWEDASRPRSLSKEAQTTEAETLFFCRKKCTGK